MTAKIELPEHVDFKFDNERQVADFKRFADDKRDKLGAELKKELALVLPPRG